jgi:hypothetical protein
MAARASQAQSARQTILPVLLCRYVVAPNWRNLYKLSVKSVAYVTVSCSVFDKIREQILRNVPRV